MGLPQLDATEIRFQICQAADFPPMPLSLHRLLEVIQDETASIQELESIIQYDQSLSSKILRMANSSYYGFRGRISTLSRAMVLIGFDEVKAICFSALLMQLVSDKNVLNARQREDFWKHALVAGKVAGMISRKRPWMGREEAHGLGLLHDLGKVMMAVHLNEHYQCLLDLSKVRKVPLWCAESAYGLGHTTVGRWIAVKWGLPEVFQRVLEFHHAPDATPNCRSEVKMIYLANVLSNSIEYPEFLNDELTLSYCNDLCVAEEEWEEYQEKLDTIWAEVNQMWDLLK